MSTRREEPRALTMGGTSCSGCPGCPARPTRGLLSSPGCHVPSASTRAQLGFAAWPRPRRTAGQLNERELQKPDKSFKEKKQASSQNSVVIQLSVYHLLSKHSAFG